ncbi:MAG: aminotransferase class I/II-fold pyridoxal phosphate-dependent enzyme [Acidobacteria bacterium]|nr:MAG: aminotransferase class I/II-fold pyridoxal phosphate-dependent enzyme [Acidobacteriota bacterium]REK01580.1 MAG: aminotransferase class I/II-fold pyridoxal phosphate-dependent enzyme [Acidobacteriota bacterium]REK14536.1 MAG: aminotransferase class I/II-fold pyridoxal phosphate-dependent enzyme [Acidobacteriota bacterium]REK45251.1 MAG: aminotransferase class I/II-fold pyridoxal phosphate-dependent enzyme [Acidobacteriota bacterium]
MIRQEAGKARESLFDQSTKNPRLSGVKASATLSINELSKRLEAEGKEIFKLGFGQSPFPVPELLVEALRKNAHRKEYLPVKGLPKLREAVAEYYRSRLGLDADDDDIVIGPGSKELMFLLQLVRKGRVLIPSPSWVSYEPQCRLTGNEPVWLETEQRDGWRLDPLELERACKEHTGGQKLLILNYPSNPTGTTLDPDRLKEIAKVARQHRVIILSDEIYGELDHSGNHISIARFYPEGTIVSTGLSKWCGAGGWRLGTFCIPKELREIGDMIGKVASETFSAVSAPIQYAGVDAFAYGQEIADYVEVTRSVLSAVGKETADRLRSMGSRVAEPEGGFYLFPDFSTMRGQLEARDLRTSEQLCKALLTETGVAALPGSEFGRPEMELSLRIAYVDFNGSECLASLQKGAKPDLPWLREHCGRVINSIERIAGWVAK